MIINDEIIAIKDLIVANSDCEQVYLFGSYAYGTPTPDSDYDFYVVLNDNAKNPIEVTGDLWVSYGDFRLDLIRQNKRSGIKTKTMTRPGYMTFRRFQNCA
jgi:predicted nucleotidyltransferase